MASSHFRCSCPLGLPVWRGIQAEQLRSIDTERIGEPLGQLPDSLMAALDDALRLRIVC